jgi:hypothetical protein
MEKKFIVIGIISIIVIGTIASIGYFFFYDDIFEETIEPSDNDEKSFRVFNIGNHNFSSIAYGDVNNTYFRLNIGYRITLEGEEEGDDILVNITVLNRTEMVGGIETRVVEERELEDGEIVEISYNYVALCNETNDIVYFGELSYEYEDGEISGTGGSWRAEGENKPGILMPGIFIVGDRYYQEYAPEDALDRGENLEKGLTFDTPIGQFSECVVVEESNELEPPRIEYKVYAPGIGMIADETLIITNYEYVTEGIN